MMVCKLYNSIFRDRPILHMCLYSSFEFVSCIYICCTLMGGSERQIRPKKSPKLAPVNGFIYLWKGPKYFMAIVSKNKKICWFKGHEIDNSTSINADIIKVIDIVGCEGWELVGSIQAIPICCHMNLYSPTLTPNFDLPWPLRPLCDLLDIFFSTSKCPTD